MQEFNFCVLAYFTYIGGIYNHFIHETNGTDSKSFQIYINTLRSRSEIEIQLRLFLDKSLTIGLPEIWRFYETPRHLMHVFHRWCRPILLSKSSNRRIISLSIFKPIYIDFGKYREFTSVFIVSIVSFAASFSLAEIYN